MEKISIIIPVYNSADSIRRCINSLLSQVFQDFIIYAVDDCSSDNSFAILQGFAEIDKRVKVYRLDKNAGPSAARNFALDICTGEWISFIDSDDYVDNLFFTELLKQENDADIIIGSFRQVTDSGTVIREYSAEDKYKAFYPEEALRIAYGGKDDLDFVYNLCWNKIYRKQLFEGVRFPVGRLQEDAYIMPSLIYNAKKPVLTARNAVYYYVNNPSSISHKGKVGISDLKRREDLVDLYETHIRLYNSYSNPLYKRSRANLLNNIISIYRLHYCQFYVSEKQIFRRLQKIFLKHYLKAISEHNTLLSAKLLSTWLLFIISPKTYLKIF